MKILRVRGKEFQGLKQFDITFPEGSACITGPNMSKKSTFARAIIWCFLGQFPHPDVSKWNNDYVLPDSSFSKGRGDETKKKKKKGSDNSSTVVETWFSMPSDATDGEDATIVYVCKRIYTKGKVYLTLKSENGAYDFQNKTQAQNIIFNLARIPSSLTYTKRVEVMTRLIWLGVGQETSIFHAKAADRKRILESTNPATKFPVWEKDSATEIKSREDSIKELNKSLSELSGEASAKNDELLRKLTSFNVSGCTKENVFLKSGEFLDKMKTQKVLPLTEIERSVEKLQRNILTLDSLSAAKTRLSQLEADILLISEKLSSFKTDENMAQKLLLEETLSELSSAMEAVNIIEEKKNKLKTIENQIVMSENQIQSSLKYIEDLDSAIIDLSLHMEAALVLAMSFNEDLEVPPSAASLDAKRSSTVFLTDVCRGLGLPHRLDLSAFAENLENIKIVHAELISKGFRGEENRLAEIIRSKEKLRSDVSEAKNLTVLIKSGTVELSNLNEKADALSVELESLNKLDSEISKTFSFVALLSEHLDFSQVQTDPCAFTRPSEQAGRSIFVQNISIFGLSLNSEEESLNSAISGATNSLTELKTKENLFKENIKSSNTLKENISNQLFSKKSEQKKTCTKILALRKSLINASTESDFSCQECGLALDSKHLDKHLRSTEKDDAELLVEISALEQSLKEITATINALENENAQLSKEILSLSSNLNLLRISAAKYYSIVGKDKCNWLEIKDNEFRRVDASLKLVSDQMLKQEDSNEKNKLDFNEVSSSIKRLLSSVEGSTTQEKILSFESLLDNESKEIRTSIDRTKEALRKSQESLSLIETSSLKFLADIGFENFQSDLLASFEIKKVDLLNAIKVQKEALCTQKEQFIFGSEELLKEEASLQTFLGISGEQNPRFFIKQSTDILKQEIFAIDTAIGKSQEVKNSFISKSASIFELKSTFPEDVWPLKEEELQARKQSILDSLKELHIQKELVSSLNDVERLHNDVTSLEKSILSTSESIEDKEDEMRANAVIKSLLSQNGDCRTFALSQDISNIVRITNDSLASLTLKHSLAVDLKLEKDESQAPTIEISFEVDGSSSNKTLPSESQRKIVGICMDLALRELSMYNGFIFIDEPETGLDEINKGKFSQFLKVASPQTIVITNLASAGFENKISTEMIANSVVGTLTDEDFDVDEIISLAKETASKDGEDDVSVYKIDRSSSSSSQCDLDDDFEDTGDI